MRLISGVALALAMTTGTSYAASVTLDLGVTANEIKKGTSPVAADNVGAEAHVEIDYGDGTPSGSGTFSALDSGGSDTGIDVTASAGLLDLKVNYSVITGEITIVPGSLVFDEALATAYLDGFSDSKPAGLGACSSSSDILPDGPGDTRNAKDCGGDDNITATANIGGAGNNIDVTFEVVEVSFSESLFIDEIQIFDANHTTDFTPEVTGVDLGVFVGKTSLGDGTGFAKCTFTDDPDPNAGHFSLSGCGLDPFLAKGDSLFFLYGGTQFYVNSVTVSQVPLPAGAVLLLSGLAALAAGRRMKKKSVA